MTLSKEADLCEYVFSKFSFFSSFGSKRADDHDLHSKAYLKKNNTNSFLQKKNNGMKEVPATLFLNTNRNLLIRAT